MEVAPLLQLKYLSFTCLRSHCFPYKNSPILQIYFSSLLLVSPADDFISFGSLMSYPLPIYCFSFELPLLLYTSHPEAEREREKPIWQNTIWQSSPAPELPCLPIRTIPLSPFNCQPGYYPQWRERSYCTYESSMTKSQMVLYHFLHPCLLYAVPSVPSPSKVKGGWAGKDANSSADPTLADSQSLLSLCPPPVYLFLTQSSVRKFTILWWTFTQEWTGLYFL